MPINFRPAWIDEDLAIYRETVPRFVESEMLPPDELQAEARALAEDMLLVTPLGLRLTKETLGLAVDAGSMEAVMAMEDCNQVLCTQGEDFAEGVAAFVEKRVLRYSVR